MIYNDYLLRLIEEFARALSRISNLKQDERKPEAAQAIQQELSVLLGTDPHDILRLSTTELLARLMRTGNAVAVRQKTLFLVALLKEAGDLASETGDAERGSNFHHKALRLLLESMGSSEGIDCPQFVPTVAALCVTLRETRLPAETQAMLMQHHERNGDFAQAEDALFELLEADPGSSGIIDFGIAFYRRLLEMGDETLSRGNLARAEVEAGLRELHHRAAARRTVA